MVEEVRGGLPGAARRRVPRLARVGRARRDAGRRRRARRPHGVARLRRPDQHPVHERDDGLPQGRDPLAPQHPQQRLLRRRAVRLHRGGPGLPAGAVLPLLRHGHGQPRRGDARRVHRHPGARVRPRRDARRPSPPSAARRCTACRRCSSPSSASTTSPRYDLTSLRTGIMAGSPCPVEVMKRVQRDMHMTEVGICYGMTETSPVSTQTRVGRLARAARVHGRAARPAHRGEDHRPRYRARRAARRDRRVLHPRRTR